MRSVGNRLQERYEELRKLKTERDRATEEKATAEGNLATADREVKRLQAYKEMADALEVKKALVEVAKKKMPAIEYAEFEAELTALQPEVAKALQRVEVRAHMLRILTVYRVLERFID